MKFNKICLALVSIVLITVICAACSCSKEQGAKEDDNVIVNQFGTYYKNIDTVITYKLDGQNITKTLNEEKSLAMQGVLNKCEELKEAPKCTFSEDFKVECMSKTYYIAHDGCNHIKLNGKFYRVPESDRKILNAIFKHYKVEMKNDDVVDAHAVELKNK